ncbi:dethiobiotin synthase [Pseudohongiella spirulinae]|uniref:ATP-dependent dethiobiotin synthetase BioD n=1 Tax=Pseudohongiella spirulinae TaxID=1249552 RepID=A0A0S2KGC9_9GAMM|nr:dethiobiotin synthase [Pseudohongiella spirulinae]ALO47305.1 ATP-dependent dethiobiotin synthetase BioD [Pseudohongiella spirulinae]
MSLPKAVFVTGTDTEVGKTHVSCALLAAARKAGLQTAAMKPVASGCESTAEGLRNGDALALQAQCSIDLPYEQVNPVALQAAIAPHLAAASEGRQLSLSRLVGMARAVLMARADFTVLEGAGGWRVPLNNREMLSGLALELRLPVVLVVGIRLGCINHALLTAEAIQRDGLQLAGWVANHLGEGSAVDRQNVETLQGMLQAPLLGELPFVPAQSPDETAAYLDLAALAGN